MKTFTKTLAAAAILAAGTATQAEVTANIGATSDYIWRGVATLARPEINQQAHRVRSSR